LEVIATVMTSPYHFYFVFVPRVASNGKKVVFGEFAILFLFLDCREKNSHKSPERHLELKIYEHGPQIII
jgi:hypothetical protein